MKPPQLSGFGAQDRRFFRAPEWSGPLNASYAPPVKPPRTEIISGARCLEGPESPAPDVLYTGAAEGPVGHITKGVRTPSCLAHPFRR